MDNKTQLIDFKNMTFFEINKRRKVFDQIMKGVTSFRKNKTADEQTDHF